MKNLLLFAAVAALSLSCNNKNTGRLILDTDSILAANPGSCKQITSSTFNKKVILFQPVNQQPASIYKASIDNAIDSMKYLVLDVYHKNPYSLCFYIYVNKKDDRASLSVQQGGEKNKAGITAKIGILPQLRTQLIFPLSYLDNQNIFMQRYPRQLKGMIHGNRMEISDIAGISIGFSPCDSNYMSQLEIADIYFSKEPPAALPAAEKPYVDELGQWNLRDWPGKTHSLDELKDNFIKMEKAASEAKYPEEWSRFGGCKEKKFKATGFFRTHHDGKRWWMVDPEGYAFLSVGIDCIRDNTSCPVDNDKDLFSWLPDSGNALYKPAFTISKRGTAGVDFFRTNLIKVYGNDWKRKWDEVTPGMLRMWSINTIANWSDIAMARKADIPYVYNMNGYPSTRVKLFRDFPDVFSQEYRDAAITYAQQLDSLKDDPFLIGFFLSNEPNWAFGSFNIAFEMFATNTPSDTKSEFVRWMKARYNNSIASLNASWNLKLESFDALAGMVIKNQSDISQAALSELYEFTKIMVREYVKTPCSEVKKIDRNHLNLGLRYAWISSDLCYEAGNDFDVFSINSYANPAPSASMISEITRRSGKPVIIGEFHFGAVDRGLPATGIQGAENQAARGDAYRYYVEQTISMPEIIGVHYFQWLDQAVTGRFDGENYNIGFIDICNRPYEELVKAAKETHERMYKIALGKEKAFDKVIKKVPQIYY